MLYTHGMYLEVPKLNQGTLQKQKFINFFKQPLKKNGKNCLWNELSGRHKCLIANF